jgi:hypothetical protein
MLLSGGYRLKVAIPQRKLKGKRIFELYLMDQCGSRSKTPVFRGIHSQGLDSTSNWIDGDYYERVEIDGKSLHLPSLGLDKDLFKTLGSLIPPGGSLMVSYELFHGEGELHIETAKGLELGHPTVCTPLGYLLFIAGCTVDFRNWYFSEGSFEGPRKIQSFKSIDDEQQHLKNRELVEELRDFIRNKQMNHSVLTKKVRERALDVIKSLEI